MSEMGLNSVGLGALLLGFFLFGLVPGILIGRGLGPKRQPIREATPEERWAERQRVAARNGGHAFASPPNAPKPARTDHKPSPPPPSRHAHR